MYRTQYSARAIPSPVAKEIYDRWKLFSYGEKLWEHLNERKERK